MSNETTNEPTNEETSVKPEGMTEENWAELIKAVLHNGLVALRAQFNNVEGQVLNYGPYGPVFVFHVKDEEDSVYSCGYFLNELIARFQSGNDPSVWMSSFFVDLMETKGGKPFPQQAASEDEAKAIIDNILVPQCIKAVTEEFAPEQVHAGLSWNKELGPVFEAGFPSIVDGNNVCAIPLPILLTHLQLNRDPGELLVQSLYHIRKEQGMD